jgi:DNA-binding MarR family transcriptional regulator
MAQHPAEVRRDTGGDLVTELVEEVFRLNGRLLRAGDTLAAEFGLTSARWQVLGALGAGPATVAQVARQRGLRRQSVQEVVTRLRADGLVTVRPNPADRRSPLVGLTPQAEQVLAAMRPAQATWANRLGSTVTAGQLADAVQTLAAVRAALDT